jgi:hypothetical protein
MRSDAQGSDGFRPQQAVSVGDEQFATIAESSYPRTAIHQVNRGRTDLATQAPLSYQDDYYARNIARLDGDAARYWDPEFRPGRKYHPQPAGGRIPASLCRRAAAVPLLPAASSSFGKTTVVVSPLIALMQDQAAQLAQMGIPAAAVNSFQTSSEHSKVIVNAKRGNYRLIYLSPERLARQDTFEWLSRVPVGFFAVDEAHCISEWGHEFRPDYRQLSRLRTRFPDLPIAGFTASATRQVRHDILKQLQLRADLYIASFHRENLRYITRECESIRRWTYWCARCDITRRAASSFTLPPSPGSGKR